MAIAIKLSIDGVSNQIPMQSIAHGDLKSFIVLQPKIDKLSMTFDLPEKEEGKAILESLEKLAKPGSNFTKLKAAGRYTRRFHVQLWENDSKVLIEAAPKGEVNPPPFFRVEFNPDKLGSDGISELWDKLIPDHAWPFVVEHSRVTRLDIAVDMLGIGPDSLLIDRISKAPKLGKRILYVGSTGSTETIYPKLYQRPLGMTHSDPLARAD